jgi:hypothetical protein
LESATVSFILRGAFSTVLILIALLTSLSARGDSFAGTPAPPANLPRLIGECETGPNYVACSVWIWQGSSYSAIWQNGAIGQITVSSGSGTDVQFQRGDTAGVFSGMRATYTAKWDGSQISNGKMAFTFNGVSATIDWIGNPAVTPVVADPQQKYSFVNWYTSQLTAYAIINHDGSWNGSQGTEIDDYRFRGEQPMNPGESRAFSNKYFAIPDNYVKGANYPQASSIAAIYADGTTFGDDKVLAAMIARRQRMIAALTTIGTNLCTLAQQNTVQGIESALEQERTREDSQSPAGRDERDAAYDYVLRSFGVRGVKPGGLVGKVFDRLNQLRSGLAADPVKGNSGQLIVSPVVPLPCNLP